MVYKLSVALLKSMNRVIHNFVWFGSIYVMRHLAVSWDKCCLPIKMGGLGIKNLVLLNKALLGKLAWKLF